ncbi:glycosyl hydrolase family 17 protein [Psychroflexus sediminis]|uniref:Endo-1,3-beta-glucanase btgC n=1 Tax=Psychroflexus sediminis TaxID=470826 RepID=A0A1G7TTB6_9FLAO|nr:glycosyl hydrolase family 17 protein [Psychroflexus sediminis]SDG38244.1 Exo-beta-1,3-glucanase, GH17 family [Psychroflexus sediminis]
MKPIIKTILIGCLVLLASCTQTKKEQKSMQNNRNLTAKEILNKPDYLAISYGGYRKKTRDSQPTLKELKEDLKILHAMDIRVLRTYNVRLPHAANILKAIKELKAEDENFEMYVMLGAWIDCKNAWTELPLNHNEGSVNNAAEIDRAVELANMYPDIVKIIAVGNEAMVKWASAYFVQPHIILKWVKHLQNIKKEGGLDKNVWITSSDNFASWGGGESEYHTPELEELIKSVDYLSVHTYPMHDTHYNPVFWGILPKETKLTNLEKLDKVMDRALSYAVTQYDSVASYVKSLGLKKQIHIGETGWASYSDGFYSMTGSRATDEYKQALYYHKMREWSTENKVKCFYFEAFDEPWKDAHNPKGSENYFGLFTVDGKAKYALWEAVDRGAFEGLKRGKHEITKTYDGKLGNLLLDVQMPLVKNEIMVNH